MPSGPSHIPGLQGEEDQEDMVHKAGKSPPIRLLGGEALWAAAGAGDWLTWSTVRWLS